MKAWIRDVVGGLLLQAGWMAPRRRAAGQLSVMTFHRVLPGPVRERYPFPEIAVTPEELAWFLDFFTTHFECGPVSELADRWRAGEHTDRPLLAISFDDGQRDNYEHARPVLRDAGVRASFFPSTEHVETGEPIWHDRLGGSILRILERDGGGGAAALRTAGIEVPPSGDIRAAILQAAERAKALEPEARAEQIVRVEGLANHTPREPEPWEGIMSWAELAELARDGHEIGSHSRSHALLPQCGDAELVAEITGSRLRLRQELGIDCDCFCYPNGDNDPRTVRAVADAGYRYAITTHWGSNPPGANPLTLKRCNMNAAQVVDRFGRPSTARLAWRLSGLHPGLS